MKIKKYPILNPVTGRIVNAGVLRGDTFVKKVKSSQKLLILDAYGIEASVIEDLRKEGCEKIVLQEDGKREYAVDFTTFYTKAIKKTFGNSSYQFYLPMSYWRLNETEKQNQLTIFELA